MHVKNVWKQKLDYQMYDVYQRTIRYRKSDQKQVHRFGYGKYTHAFIQAIRRVLTLRVYKNFVQLNNLSYVYLVCEGPTAS